MARRSRRQKDDAVVDEAARDGSPSEPERSAVEVQRRSSVAEFELRTALTAIAGWADTLREWQSLSSAQVDRAVAILGARAADACRLAEDLVADVEAELSTLALHPVLVDLVALLEASVRPYVGASMGREIVVLSHVPIWAQVDPVAFRQVCAHLIENAVDSTPQGGTISVRIRQVGDRAEIEFSDEGIGIPEGVDVFAPFARAPHRDGQGGAGSGLGLHVVKRLAAAIGGEVGARPNKEKGSTFTFGLPSGQIEWPPRATVPEWEAETIAHGPMGLVCQYFAARDDEAAAVTVDWSDGPGVPPRTPGLFRHRVAPFRTVSLDGVEPVVMMGRLESLLTGRGLDEVFHDRTSHQVAGDDEGELVVWRLSRTLRNVLATSDRAHLDEVARQWSETEEFSGRADSSVLAEQLSCLAELARTALEQGLQLYCWLSV